MAALAFTPDELRELARELAPLLAAALSEGKGEAGWMDAKAAAEYAGTTVAALHKATAAREIRFTQEKAGGKCWFRREWIDQWRGI